MNSLLAFLLDWPDLEMPIHKFLVVFVTAVQLLSPRVQSQVTFDQPCPKLDVVRDFDLHRVRRTLKSEPTDSVGPFWPPPDWFVAINLWRIVTNRLQIFDLIFPVSWPLVRNWKLSGRLQLVRQLCDGQLFLAGRWQRPSDQPEFQHQVKTLLVSVIFKFSSHSRSFVLLTYEWIQTECPFSCPRSSQTSL
jgi:hypothetical protein